MQVTPGSCATLRAVGRRLAERWTDTVAEAHGATGAPPLGGGAWRCSSLLTLAGVAVTAALLLRDRGTTAGQAAGRKPNPRTASSAATPIAQDSPHASPPPPPVVVRPSRGQPLELWIGGDSLGGELGWSLAALARSTHVIKAGHLLLRVVRLLPPGLLRLERQGPPGDERPAARRGGHHGGHQRRPERVRPRLVVCVRHEPLGEDVPSARGRGHGHDAGSRRQACVLGGYAAGGRAVAQQAHGCPGRDLQCRGGGTPGRRVHRRVVAVRRLRGSLPACLAHLPTASTSRWPARSGSPPP